MVYDDDGRLSTLTADGQQTTFSYDAAGNQTRTTLPAGNGYSEEHSYDRAGRVTEVATTRPAAPASRPAKAKAVTAAAVAPAAGQFTALSPARIENGRQLAGSGTYTFTPLGQGGIPTSGVAAVSFHLTAKSATGSGALVVISDPQRLPPPMTQQPFSYPTGNVTVANLVVTSVSSTGTVTIRNTGTTPVTFFVDVNGYYSTGGAATGGRLVPVNPALTRAPFLITAGTPVLVAPLGTAGVPATGVTAVLLSITYNSSAAAGYTVVFPSNLATRPGTSDVQYQQGKNGAAQAPVKLGPDGKFKIDASVNGTATVVVLGYYLAAEAPAAGSQFVPTSDSAVTPQHIAVGASASVPFRPLGTQNVPATGVQAVVFNLTVANTGTATGGITVSPGDISPTGFATLHYQTGTFSTLQAARVAANGQITLRNGGTATLDATVDVIGYYATPTAPAAPTAVTATPGSGSATVTWTAPAADGGAPVSRYTVTGSGGGSATTDGPTTAVITGLTAGTPYTFTVTATNAVGTGPASAASAPVIPRAPPPTTLADYTLTLDAVGNPVQVVTDRTTPSGPIASTDTYTYDPADRLTAACYGATDCAGAAKAVSYTYDLVGNRQTETRTGLASPGVTTYRYDAADQLTATTGAAAASYGYDLDGNQTAAGPARYSYDLLNRVATAAPAGAGGSTYGYDPDGNRLTATTGTATTTYAWDVSGQLPTLAVERTGTSARSYRYKPDGSPLSTVTGAQVSYYTHDAFSNVSDISAAADGTPLWAYTYEPFGTVTAAIPLAPSTPVDPMRFAGEYQDPASGLYNLRARQYDPRQGRFTATDPLDSRNDPAVSTYIYADDQPTVATDPTGQFCIFGRNPDGSCRGHRVVDGIGTAVIGAQAAAADFTLGLGYYLGSSPEERGEILKQAGAALISDCLAGAVTAGAGANAAAGCLRQLTGIADIVDGLVLAFHGCIYWGAYQAANGTITLLLSLAPFGAGKAADILGTAVIDADGTVAARTGAAVDGGGVVANQAAGNAARDAIAAAYPGSATEVSFPTALGTRRVDLLTRNRIAIESKVGRTSLTSTVRSQIAKDQWLLENGRVRGVQWIFVRSTVNGQIGPTGPLQAALNKAGISWRLWP
jgi:RHS repeat-associated protein